MAVLVLWSLAIFLAKHFLCEFVLAPHYGLRGASRYIDGPRLVLALLHGAGSAPAVLLLTGSGVAVATVLIAEVLLTYHLVWCRDRALTEPRLAAALRPESVAGAEQLLHQLFYLAVIALLR